MIQVKWDELRPHYILHCGPHSVGGHLELLHNEIQLKIWRRLYNEFCYYAFLSYE